MGSKTARQSTPFAQGLIAMTIATAPAYAVLDSDVLIGIDVTSAPVVLNLPPIGQTGNRGLMLYVLGDQYQATITPSGSETIDGGVVQNFAQRVGVYLLYTRTTTDWGLIQLQDQLTDGPGRTSALEIINSASGGPVIIHPKSDVDTDVDLWLFGLGAGKVRTNGGIPVPTSATSTTPGAGVIPIADGSALLDAWISANAAAGTPSLRKLGTGATDAAAGNDSRFGVATDTELAAIAGLTSAANKGIIFTGSGSAATFDLTAAALTVLDDVTVGAMLATLGGQPLDAELTAIAALASAADNGIYFTGSGTASLFSLTSAARALLDDTTAGVMLETLGIANPLNRGRLIQVFKTAGATSTPFYTTVGIGAGTESGTVSNVDGANGANGRFVTGSSSGNSAGYISASYVARIGWNADVIFLINVGNTITSYALWCGLTTVTLANVTTPTTQGVAAFAYDTSQDGLVQWYAVVCDGASGVQRFATGVAIVAAAMTKLRIVTTVSSVLFYINDVLVKTHTSNIPLNLQLLAEMNVTTLTASTRRGELCMIEACVGK